jgi:hypothetical protein
MNDFPLTGGCNCGGGSIRGDRAARRRQLLPLQALPASQRSGSVGERPPRTGTFRIVAGEARLRAWKPDNGGEKWFCGDLWLVAVGLDRVRISDRDSTAGE